MDYFGSHFLLGAQIFIYHCITIRPQYNSTVYILTETTTLEVIKKALRMDKGHCRKANIE